SPAATTIPSRPARPPASHPAALQLLPMLRRLLPVDLRSKPAVRAARPAPGRTRDGITGGRPGPGPPGSSEAPAGDRRFAGGDVGWGWPEGEEAGWRDGGGPSRSVS